jgi:hypothetical protein
MKFRMLIIVLAGALSLTPLVAAQSGRQAFAFAGPTGRDSITTLASQQRYSQGQRNILELMADRLDFSGQQSSQLQILMGRQQQMLAALHQNSRLDDQHRQELSEAIRQQTKDQFIAMLTPEQRRQFGWMQRLPRKAQQASGMEGAQSGQKSHVSAAELEPIQNSFENRGSASAPR